MITKGSTKWLRIILAAMLAVGMCAGVLPVLPAAQAITGENPIITETGGASPQLVWKSIETGILSAREDHTAVWTGAEMIIWGGHDDNNSLYDHTLEDGRVTIPPLKAGRCFRPPALLRREMGTQRSGPAPR